MDAGIAILLMVAFGTLALAAKALRLGCRLVEGILRLLFRAATLGRYPPARRRRTPRVRRVRISRTYYLDDES